MIYQALSGTHVAPVDIPSHQGNIDTTQDNADVQLLPFDTFDQQIQAINVALADKIKDLSFKNLLVLQAVHQMEKELPLFNCLRAKDLIFDDGWLYYKSHLYIPEIAHHDLVSPAHCSFKDSHRGHLQTIVLLSRDYWWLGLSTYIQKYVLGVWFARHTRFSPILWSQPSSPLLSKDPALSRTSSWTSSLTFLLSMALILLWLWLTMALVRGNSCPLHQNSGHHWNSQSFFQQHLQTV